MNSNTDNKWNGSNSNHESMNTIILQGKTTEEKCIHYIKNKRISKLPFIDLSLQVDLDANYVDDQGFTLLMHACMQSDNLPIVELLVRYNANINAKNTITGDTVLGVATSTPNNASTIMYLLKKNIIIDDPQIILRNLFKNSIHEKTDTRTIIEEIIKRGGNLQILDDQGLYPYEYGSSSLFYYFRNKYNFAYRCTDSDKYPITYYTISPSTESTQNNDMGIRELHIQYIDPLDSRRKFILQQYTHIGDTYVNRFLRGNITITDYKDLILDIDRDRFAIHKYIICPFLYAMLDTNVIDCISENYLLFFYEEVVQPKIKEIISAKNIQLLDRYFYYYFVDLYKIIQSFPKVSEPFIVYRGVETNYLHETIDSAPCLLPTFTSTSTNETTARGYGPILYKFTVNPKCNYAYIDSLSINAGEDEVLIAPYTKYVVRSVNEDSTLWEIELFPADISILTYDDYQRIQKNVQGGGRRRKTRRRVRR